MLDLSHVCLQVMLDEESKHLVAVNTINTGKINISACVNGILYINGAREMGMHERIASVT